MIHLPESRRHPDDRLRLTRLARGFSQGDLARAASVTRQAISGIESGRWSPSLDVALAVARALSSSVEELFGSPLDPPPVSARLAVRSPKPQAEEPGWRLLMSDVAGETIAFPLTGDGSLVPGFVPALAIVHGGDDLEAAAGDETTTRTVRRSRGRHGSIDALRIAESGPTLAVAGCDPALALLQGPLYRHDPAVGLAWWPCGNALAIDLLESGAVHAAAVHRAVDVKARHRTGVEVVGFASWREGLAIAPQHRANVNGLGDVVRLGLRVANRERGSEARRLLDAELERLNIEPERVLGYETAATAHLLVASAIHSGLADAGVTTEPAALAYGLDFIAWQEEISELHIPRSLMGGVEVRALLDVLAGRELPRQLGALRGYDAEPCGRILAA
ncbi:MAG TPA: substrate-binding domain-containing protein [Acidimicrobiales bacterium]|nr:substrate-binding domain-containing protein [Acidimicrobiales bacterium]